MKIRTKAFGTIDIDESRIMRFVGPMLGMENAVHYALLDPNPESPVKVLQLTEDPDRSFLVADPSAFFPQYKVSLPAEELAELQLDDPGKAVVLVTLTVREDAPKVTVNLRGPIVINPERFLAKQVVLKDTEYRVDEPLPITEVEA